MLSVHRQTVGLAQENTYVVVNEKNEALIFDPGDEAERLIQWIDTHQWQPKAILLTHCHFDHIGAVDRLRDYYYLDVYVHEIEEEFLMNPMLNLSYGMLGQTVSQRAANHVWTTAEMGQCSMDSFDFKMAHIPGHSPGHLVFIFEASGFVIAGDTLFENSVGRTDLPQGDYSLLIQGIQQHLLTLPDDTIIYPGHGPSTTIKAERRFNPYLNRV